MGKQPQNHLIIGLGGTGGKALREFRRILFENLNTVDPEDLANIEYLYVDTSDDDLGPATDRTGGDWRMGTESLALDKGSTLNVGGSSLDRFYDNISQYPWLKEWIGPREAHPPGDQTTAAGQRRRMGRFLLACKMGEFVDSMSRLVVKLTSKSQEKAVTFHIVAGLAGGTGSGSVLDVIAQIRTKYREAKDFKIFPYLLMPEEHPLPKWKAEYYHVNGYGALRELNALSVLKYNPIDINSSGKRLELGAYPFTQCYIYGCVTETGQKLSPQTDTPFGVANFIYTKIIRNHHQRWDALSRFEKGENKLIEPETDEIPGRQGGIPQRSRRFMTFGIKSVRVPNQEVKEYFRYGMMKQATCQLLYNNWTGFGYLDEPNKNASFEDLKSPDSKYLEAWNLTHTHLALFKPIREDEHEKGWKPLSEWKSLAPKYMGAVQESVSSDQWVGRISQMFKKKFDNDWRSSTGVEDFYRAKRKEFKQTTRAIIDKIQNNLLETIWIGENSLSDVSDILEALVESLEERIPELDEKVIKSQKKVKVVSGRCANNLNQFANMGLIARMAGGKVKLLHAHAADNAHQFTYKTEVEGYQYARELLVNVIPLIQAMDAQVKDCITILKDGLDGLGKDQDARCAPPSPDVLKQLSVKCYDRESVIETARLLDKDEEIQKQQTKELRHHLRVTMHEKASFKYMAEVLGRGNFAEFEQPCEKAVRRAVDQYKEEGKGTDVLTGNIYSQLREQFGEDTSKLSDFFGDLMREAGLFVSGFDTHQESDSRAKDTQKRERQITVFMPGSEEDTTYRQLLRTIIEQQGNVEFVDSDFADEITIVTISFNILLRYMKDVAFLRSQYQEMLETNQQVNFVIHTDADGSHFPSLYTPTASELQRETLPYLFIGLATENVEKQTEFGETAYKVPMDDDPLSTVEPVVLKGASIYSAIKTVDLPKKYLVKEQIENQVLEHPAFEERSQREAVQAAVMTILKAEITTLKGDKKLRNEEKIRINQLLTNAARECNRLLLDVN